MRNAIPRWTRSLISNPLAFKPEIFLFLPFFAKTDDVTPYKKCDNWPKNKFFAIKTQFFGCQNKNKSQNEECHISLSSLFNFQSIDIQTWKFFIFSIFRKNR